MSFHQIARARVTQIDRVNEWTPERCLLRIDELEYQVARLEAALASYQLAEQEANHRAEKTLHGRPVLSIEEAGALAGIKYHTARRYVIERFWQAEQGEDRKWFVFADQVLSKKPRKSRRK